MPPLSKYVTILHEYGHIIHLKYIKKKYSLNKYDVEKPIIIVKKKFGITFYNGKTNSGIYSYLESNKLYKDIQINAIFGSFTVVISFLLLSTIMLFMPWSPYHLIFSIPIIILELFNFLQSSDFKYFKHPEQFHYEE